MFRFFFFNDTATTEIYTLSLHDALPICLACAVQDRAPVVPHPERAHRTKQRSLRITVRRTPRALPLKARDRKSTRLNSSHANISYAVFCLKKKNKFRSSPSHSSLARVLL